MYLFICVISIIALFTVFGGYHESKKHEGSSFACFLIAGLGVVITGAMIMAYPISYAENQKALNEIELDYDTLCVMFMENKGFGIVEANIERLKKMKAENDTLLFDGTVPDRVDEIYFKYRKLQDEAYLMKFDNICRFKK